MTNIGGNMVIKKILALSIFLTNLIINGANPDIYNEWFGAASNGDLNKIKELISQVDINGQDDRGRTALMQAAFFGHADILEFLLQQPNININAQDHKKYTALSLAASVGRENIMKILLKVHHIDINTQNTITGNTPLIQASKEGHENIVNLLLNIPTINLNIRNSDGFTALMWAVWNGNESIAKRLLKAGADSSIKNYGGQTALDLASPKFKIILEPLVNQINMKDKLKQWFEAVDANDLNKIKELIRQVDVNALNKHGNPALIQACLYNSENIVDLLLQVPDININTQNLLGFTALMFATIFSNHKIIKLLLDAGADPNLKNIKGKTALDFAKSAFKPTLKELINEYRIKQTKLISRLSIELYSLSRLKI